jgi:threonine/homoserine/homoserine lactone efflux protein
VTNPKVGVFFITFLPQFVPAGVAVVPFVALLVLIHVALSAVWLGLLIAATQSVGRVVRRPAVARTLDRITGTVLIAAGLRLAAEGRR